MINKNKKVNDLMFQDKNVWLHKHIILLYHADNQQYNSA